MKRFISILLFWPLLAQAQLSTFTLSWNGVTPDQSIKVAASCSINDGAYFSAVTVPSLQTTADVVVDIQPGNKIACYAQTTDGVNYSPQSNLAVAYEPMQINAQLCVMAGTGTWKVAEMWPGNTDISPFYSLSAWDNNATLRQSLTSMSAAFIKPGTVCDPAMVLMTPGHEFHQATNAAGITGLAICTLQ